MDSKYIVPLQGREYPLYAGVLAEAHALGLQSIETQLIQIPSDENGQTAIVKAVVLMKDGTMFQGYGDASPRNVNPRIATALLRMAETRAKGRALRDACNIGQTMLEELPDLEEGGAANDPARNGHAKPAGKERAAAAVASGERPLVEKAPEGNGAAGCEVCGVALTPGQVKVSKANFAGRLFCPAHQKEQLAARKAG